MGQLETERGELGRFSDDNGSPLSSKFRCISVLALLMVAIGGCVIKKSTAGATPCTDVEVTPSKAEVVRCADSQGNMTNIQTDNSGRVASYRFDVTCSDGRHHTGSVTFSYASATDPDSILTMTVDGGTCVSAGLAGGGGVPSSGGVIGSGGAAGSGSGTHSDGGQDPCAGHDGCFSSTSLDGDQVASWRTAGGYETAVTTADGSHYLVIWEVNPTDGGIPSIAFTIQVPSGETLGTIDLGPIPTDAEGTATAAWYVVGLFASAAVPSLVSAPDSGAKLYYAFSGNNPSQWSNTAGCDTALLHKNCDCQTSGWCANRGSCCDWHDECITVNCGVPASGGSNRGSGDARDFLIQYLIATGLSAPTTKCANLTGCEACHCGVMECFLAGRQGDLFNPGDVASHSLLMPAAGPMPQSPVSFGPSNCCLQDSVCTPGKKSCGDQQQCMYDGKVIVDPCICQQHGLTSLGCGGAGGRGRSCGDAGSDVARGTCSSGVAADLGDPVGIHVFEFLGSESIAISGGGGYQAYYDLLLGADLQSNFVGMESYKLNSATLRIDVEYNSTPACVDPKTGGPVTCSSQLSECISAAFQSIDFDLSSAVLQHVAKGAASNPIPDDFYTIQLALLDERSFTTSAGTVLQYASGGQLRLGTSSGENYPEAGYFNSELILPTPYVQLGISPGGLISGQVTMQTRDAGVGP